MIKTALLAATAALLVFGVNSASARTVKYTLTGYCDGLTLTETAGTATGTHTGSDCTDGEGDYAGGFSGKRVQDSDDTQWIVTTNDPSIPGTSEIFVLDQTAMTWQVWEENSNTTAFYLYNSGTLTDGPPPKAAPGSKALKSAGIGAAK
jgi:hypothetical protein